MTNEKRPADRLEQEEPKAKKPKSILIEDQQQEESSSTAAADNADDSKYIHLLPNGAIKTTGITCQATTKCKWFGGNSGYCSVCWKRLSKTEQEEATAVQMKLEPARAREADREAQEKKHAEQLEKEKQEREVRQRKDQYVQERELLKQQGKAYPIQKFVQDYEDDGSEEASNFGQLCCSGDGGVRETLQLWNCGVYNTKFGTPESLGEPSIQQMARHTELKARLRSCFGGLLLQTEGDYSFVPYIIPVAGIPKLESLCVDAQTTIEHVLEVSERASQSVSGFASHANKKKMLTQAVATFKQECLSGSFCVFEPPSSDSCCIGPIIIAGVDKVSGKDVVLVSSYITWT